MEGKTVGSGTAWDVPDVPLTLRWVSSGILRSNGILEIVMANLDVCNIHSVKEPLYHCLIQENGHRTMYQQTCSTLHLSNMWSSLPINIKSN